MSNTNKSYNIEFKKQIVERTSNNKVIKEYNFDRFILKMMF